MIFIWTAEPRYFIIRFKGDQEMWHNSIFCSFLVGIIVWWFSACVTQLLTDGPRGKNNQTCDILLTFSCMEILVSTKIDR